MSNWKQFVLTVCLSICFCVRRTWSIVFFKINLINIVSCWFNQAKISLSSSWTIEFYFSFKDSKKEVKVKEKLWFRCNTFYCIIILIFTLQRLQKLILFWTLKSKLIFREHYQWKQWQIKYQWNNKIKDYFELSFGKVNILFSSSNSSEIICFSSNW